MQAGSIAPLAPVRPARRRLVTRAVSDGRRLGLSVAPIDDSSAILRGLKPIWFGPRHQWLFSGEQHHERRAGAIRAAFRQRPLVDLEGLDADLRSAIEAPSPNYFTEVLDLQILPLEQGGFAVSSAFDPYLVASMRALQGRFHRYAAAWQVAGPVERILESLQQIAGVDPVFVFVHEQPMRLEDLVAKPKAEMPISVSGATPAFGDGEVSEEKGCGFLSSIGSPMARFDVDEDVLGRAVVHCGLYDYQADGARHLLGRSSALLGDDMGLGKSRQAVVASRIAAGRGRILVVCPASLRIN